MITTSLLRENFMIDSLSQFRQRLALQTHLLKKKDLEVFEIPLWLLEFG